MYSSIFYFESHFDYHQFAAKQKTKQSPKLSVSATAPNNWPHFYVIDNDDYKMETHRVLIQC